MTRFVDGSAGGLRTFAGNPSADLDQCANDPLPSSHADGCSSSASEWVNGNLGASKAVYLEGDSVPYRMRFDNLPLSSHTVTIEWDTTKSGKHAFDYLTTYNRTVGDANPCLGVFSPCAASTTSNVPTVPGLPFTQASGVFTLFGGTITGVSGYTDSGSATGDGSSSITVTFTANVANPVLAWAGHIADRHDWNDGLGAITIPGSPYHMRLLNLDGSGGNQDRSLSADAVIFPATITVIKHATPTDASANFGFTASPAPLANFTVNGSNAASNDRYASGPISTFQVYTVSENTPPSGWSFVSLSCSAGTTANGGSATPTGSQVALDVKEGEDWVCTYNNVRATTLTLVKQVTNDDGGTAAASAWTLSANAAGDPNNFSGAGPTVGPHAATAGAAYTLAETAGPAGYTPGSWSCDGGSLAGGAITLSSGDAVTCTIVNNDNAPQLKLVKSVTNDDGGTAGQADFTLSAAAASPNDGRNFTSASASPAFHNVLGGVSYDLSETGPSGYTSNGEWSCTGGTLNGAKNAVTVAIGTQATCTIVNNDVAPQLKLVKSVTNDDGGSATAADWTLAAAAASPNDGRNFTSATASPAFHNVLGGVSYGLSESGGPAGYSSNGEWSCTGGTLNGAKNAVTVAIGGSATCTIVNNDVAPQLKLVKSVINNDGGTATAANWTLAAAAASPNDGRNFTSATASPAFHNVLGGVSYALSESGGPSGYSSTGEWACDGGTLNGAKNAVTVALGASATCTIVNNDAAPQLKLVKSVTNDDGGTAGSADWTLAAAAASPNDARNFTSASASPTFHEVLGGVSYALSETGGPAGYSSNGEWSCTGGTLNGAKNAVTVAIGGSATCTIVNNDVAPQLKLVKSVTNDDGGAASAADWTLAAAAASPNDGRNFTSASATPAFHNVLGGVSYTLSETGGPAGYSSSGEWSCTGGTLNEAKNAVTIAVGGQATCTIVNTDDVPQLKLVKSVVNDDGGTAGAGDWTLSAAAASPNNARNFTSASATPEFHNVLGGVSYTLSESGGPAGYSSDGQWSCDGGTLNEAKNAVAVAIGSQAVCTITNDDIAPQITIEKRLLPANDSGTFDFTIDPGEGATVLTNDGAGYGNLDSETVDVSTGTHTITESGHGSTAGSDYASSWSCSNEQSGSGTSIALRGIALDEHITCVFTNTKLAKLIVQKVVDNSNGGGSKGAGDFTLHVSTGGVDLPGSPAAGSATGTTYSGLLPGTYKVNEDAVSGYNLTGITGCLADGSVVLEAGSTVTCTLTNKSNAPPPPPPPPPPAPRIDLSITKTGAPSPLTVGGNITWTLVVTNNGPNGATGVNVADPIPAGTTYISAATSQGTCTGGAILSCQIGNLGVGASVTISLVTTANATGTIPNTATTVGNEVETNTTNNSASASVQVVGVFTPPPTYCTALAVSPKQLLVGHKNTLTIKVSQHGKAMRGVKIRIKGSSISVVTPASNGKGLVKRTVKPTKAGIVTFVPVAQKGCKNPRVGVIGVFTPPVTG